MLSVILYGYETSLHTVTEQIEDAGGQSKGKEIPVQPWTGPEGTWRCEECQHFAPVAFTPQKIFLLEAESTTGQ